MKNRDTASFESTTTDDLTIVASNGKVSSGRKTVVAALMDTKCQIKAAEVIDPAGSAVLPTLSILTYKAAVSGTCDGRVVTPTWTTTIFQQEGGEWRAVYVVRTNV